MRDNGKKKTMKKEKPPRQIFVGETKQAFVLYRCM